MECVKCKTVECYTKGKDCTGRREEIAKLYGSDPADMAIMQAAARLEEQGRIMLPRVQEVLLFARTMGYRHLGMAFCAGLHREARLLADLLAPHFKITSACCKVCGIAKKDMGLPAGEAGDGRVMCNPVGQAAIVNRAATELNLVVGLCVGHDLLFARHSQAPVTTVIVKDRVLANNPAGALQSPYWMRIIRENRTLGLGGPEDGT